MLSVVLFLMWFHTSFYFPRGILLFLVKNWTMKNNLKFSVKFVRKYLHSVMFTKHDGCSLYTSSKIVKTDRNSILKIRTSAFFALSLSSAVCICVFTGKVEQQLQNSTWRWCYRGNVLSKHILKYPELKPEVHY